MRKFEPLVFFLFFFNSTGLLELSNVNDQIDQSIHTGLWTRIFFIPVTWYYGLPILCRLGWYNLESHNLTKLRHIAWIWIWMTKNTPGITSDGDTWLVEADTTISGCFQWAEMEIILFIHLDNHMASFMENYSLHTSNKTRTSSYWTAMASFLFLTRYHY